MQGRHRGDIRGHGEARPYLAAHLHHDLHGVVLAAAKAEPKVAAEIAGKSIVKEIYVPGKLVNIVAR